MSWTKLFSREYGVQYTEAALRALGDEVKDILPYNMKHHVFLPENKNQAYYCYINEFDKLSEECNKKFVNNLMTLKKFIKLFIDMGEEYVRTAKELSDINVNNYKKYLKSYIKYTCLLWVGFILPKYQEKKMQEISKKYNFKQDEEKIVFAPSKKSSIHLLIKLLQKKKDINGLYEEFRWLPCMDIHNKPYTFKEFREFISSLNTEKKEEKDYRAILKEKKVLKEDKEFVETVKNLIYLRDLRDDYRRQGVYFSQKFFKKILPLDKISYMTEQEVIDYIENKKIPDIEERKKGFLIYLKNVKTYCFSGKEIKVELKKLGIKLKPESKEIKGIIAFKGNVTGKAKIVVSIKDLKKVEKKDIMIAVTTHPDFVSAISKAAAIVTDEGGITSHAAIVARELGIPCIVGTRIATKVFKDGDYVEVDADKGVVRKIVCGK